MTVALGPEHDAHLHEERQMTDDRAAETRPTTGTPDAGTRGAGADRARGLWPGRWSSWS